MIFNIHNSIKDDSGIYAIRNCMDERFYIGSTVGFYKRYSDHLRLLKKRNHANKYLQSFSNKYGLDMLSFELMFLCKNTCLVFNEKLYIDTLKPQFNIRKIIQRPYFEDVEKYDIKAMRDAFDEADRRMQKQLDEYHKKYPPIQELTYRETKDYYFGIPPSCPFPREIIIKEKAPKPKNGIYYDGKEEQSNRSRRLSEVIEECRAEYRKPKNK